MSVSHDIVEDGGRGGGRGERGWKEGLDRNETENSLPRNDNDI